MVLHLALEVALKYVNNRTFLMEVVYTDAQIDTNLINIMVVYSWLAQHIVRYLYSKAATLV